MNLDLLRTELTVDPLVLGYGPMTDQAAAASLNAPTRTRNRTSMTGSEVLNAVDVAEWGDLDAAQQQRVWDVIHLGEINPFGIEATLLTGVFGASATITALQAARQEAISRATELGLGVVRVGHIQQARA